MRKKLLAISGALLAQAAMLGTAHADGSNLTLFGIVDGGFMTQDNAATKGGGYGRQSAFVDGQFLPSIWGMKGSDDLGGGLKATFALEGGLSSGTGGFDNSNGGIFGRVAEVGLTGRFGSVNFGLQVDPAFLSAIPIDPRGMTDSFSALGPWLALTIFSNTVNPSGAVPLNGGIFDTNSVAYTWAGGGFSFTGLYGAGGVAGSGNAGAVESLGATYKFSGFTISGGALESHDVNGNKAGQEFDLGGAYDFDPFAVRLVYTKFKDFSLTETEMSDTSEWGLGFDWATGGLNKINISYYYLNNAAVADDTTRKLALIDYYYLSKRTTMYAQIADVKQSSGATVYTSFDAYVPSSTAPGKSTTYIGLGLAITF